MFLTDLWIYIKDTVTASNILSVDQLLKKLIDAVQQVPKQFLEPVVEASIKRSHSLDLGSLSKYLTFYLIRINHLIK